MTKNVPQRRVYKKAPILEAVIDFRLTTEINSDFEYQSPAPKKTYKMKVRITEKRRGTPTKYE